MEMLNSAEAVASHLGTCRYLNAEFMYKPRPQLGRERMVFDFTLQSRLNVLSPEDAVLFICSSPETAASLGEITAQYPHLSFVAVIVNSPLWAGKFSDTPHKLNWPEPDRWQRYIRTDRWARIDFALHIASLLPSPGYLLMPAHDAVWSSALLPTLVRFSQQHPLTGQPAAVSPYPYYQHSPVPGVDIPTDVIDKLNMAFARDSCFSWKIRRDQVQAFWGKMSLTPFSMCGPLRKHTEQQSWEDDLEIDRVLRELGFAVRCLWVSNPALYRQALPVFDDTGLRTVIERTLHYSLNIPGSVVGGSTLNIPLDSFGKLKCVVNPRFARLNTNVEQLVTSCVAVISHRIAETGASWVDWGAYRYVCRVGDPVVEVWKNNANG